MNDRIKELTEMGEFKTHSEAIEYCRLHGINELHFDKYAFTIAGALMDARKGQDKITRHACAENVQNITPRVHPNHKEFDLIGKAEAINKVKTTKF